eukprot:UN16707
MTFDFVSRINTMLSQNVPSSIIFFVNSTLYIEHIFEESEKLIEPFRCDREKTHFLHEHVEFKAQNRCVGFHIQKQIFIILFLVKIR